MTLEELRKLQLLQTGAMTLFDKICRDNDIKYYMVKGTLIGAVRHKGFIPWDIDCDFAMYREDYERFLKISTPLIPAEYTLKHTAVDKNCCISFARLIVNDVIIIKPFNSIQKVQIDIFILDYMKKNSRLISFLKEKLLLFLGYIHSYKINKWKIKGMHAWWKNCLLIVGNFFTFTFKGEDFDNIIKKISGYKKYRTDYTAILSSRYGYSKEMYKSEYFSETIELEFEGKKFLAPGNFHEILTKTYGNYMEFPPENKRYPWYFNDAVIVSSNLE